MKKLIIVGLLLLVETYAYSQQISLNITRPSFNEVVGNSLYVSTWVESDLEISTVQAKVESNTKNLSYNFNTGRFEGSLVLTNMSQDTSILEITAIDIEGNSSSATRQFIYDPPPTLEVLSPINESLARPTIDVSMKCSEVAGDSCVTDIVVESLLAYPVDYNVIFQGGQEVSETLDLSDYEGQMVKVHFRTRDNRNQGVVKSKTIYVDSSPYLKQIAQVSNPISDFDGNSLIYTTTTGAEIYNLNSSTISSIPFNEKIDPETLILTQSGAIFQQDVPNTYPGLFEWKNGSLFTISADDYVSSIKLDGDYLIWYQNGSLYRKQISNDNMVMVGTNSASYFNDVNENGMVAYWDKSYNIHAFINDTHLQLTNDDESITRNTSVVCDGENLIYSKSSGNGIDKKYALIFNDGFSETTIRDFETRQYPGYYQIVNGYIAYNKFGNLGQEHVWIRDPSMEDHQITFFGSDSEIDLLNPEGTILFKNSRQRYLAKYDGSTKKIGSGLGKSYFVNNRWYVTMGRTLLEVDTLVEHNTLSDLSATINRDSTLNFSKEFFLPAFNGPGELITLKILELPASGTLEFNGVIVDKQTEINRNEINMLRYIPNSNFVGLDSISWNASNGISYANENAKVYLNVVDGVLGVKDNSDQGEVNIYPNPATNRINITKTSSFEGYLFITVYNMQGEVVMTKMLDGSKSEESNRYSFNITDLKSGMYTIKITTPAQNKSIKFLKQ